MPPWTEPIPSQLSTTVCPAARQMPAQYAAVLAAVGPCQVIVRVPNPTAVTVTVALALRLAFIVCPS